jgi:hypothetical protein
MTQQQEEEISLLDNEQKNRLWQYKMQEETTFNSRLNFFLVFESVLLSVVGLLSSKTASSDKVVLISIISLGFILTILWGYIQAKNKSNTEIIRALAVKALPEYRMVRTQLAKWPVPTMPLLTYGIPILVGLIWIALLIAVIVA